MREPRRFAQLDVFADRPGAGNPLAVVVDAEGLDDAQMQAFANWTNLSETTFLLPPSSSQASYRVRIFTPRQELPFAGHPSVGSAHAALEAGLVHAIDGALVQECAAGLLPMRIVDEADHRCIFVRAPRARFPSIPSDCALDELLASMECGELAAAMVDNGPCWWVVELASERVVRELAPDLAAIARLTLATGTVGFAVFARSSGAEFQVVVRAFCPADGIPEDPVTGSANAAIAALMLHRSALQSPCYVASQGREVGRDGRVRVEVDADGEVWIGGQTQTVVSGTLDW